MSGTYVRHKMEHLNFLLEPWFPSNVIVLFSVAMRTLLSMNIELGP